LQPIFPEGKDREGLDELVEEFDKAAHTISNEVSADSVVNKVLLGD